MTHPLITRLSDELGWPRLESEDQVEAFIGAPGAHVLFVPGDSARTLEPADVAVILPELCIAFKDAFDCAVVCDAVEPLVREKTQVFKTPCLIFYRDGRFAGAIPKVRDWDDYTARVAHILAVQDAAE